MEDFEYRRGTRRYFRHVDSDLQDSKRNQTEIVRQLKTSSEIQKELVEKQHIITGGLMTNMQVLQQSLVRYNTVLEENRQLIHRIEILEQQSTVNNNNNTANVDVNINNVVNHPENIPEDIIPENITGVIQEPVDIDETLLTGQQLIIFNFIREHQGLTRKQLAQQLGIKLGSINGQVRRMIKLHYLYDNNHRIFIKTNTNNTNNQE